MENRRLMGYLVEVYKMKCTDRVKKSSLFKELEIIDLREGTTS